MVKKYHYKIFKININIITLPLKSCIFFIRKINFMCGFVGIIGDCEVEDNKIINNMTAKISHRGIYNSKNWSKQYEEGSISLGFRRFPILDNSHNGDQPMYNEIHKLVIVFNGEIYNFKDLKKELISKGYLFKGNSDTEVLLNGYVEWGFDLVKYINGMFSFIIWDENKKKAFLARDRFGEKPLYWTPISSTSFIFASEAKSILQHPKVSCAINKSYFKNNKYHSSKQTIFKNIYQFPAGSLLIIDLRKIEFSPFRYWVSDFTIDKSLTNSPIAINNKVDELYKLLNNSLNLRLQELSIIDYGIMLSGGIDSSILAGIIQSQQRVTALSVIFPGYKKNEEDLIREFSQLQNIENVFLKPNIESIIGCFREIHLVHENIIRGPSICLEWLIAKKAKKLGMKVLISGQGADELFCGYTQTSLILKESNFLRFSSKSNIENFLNQKNFEQCPKGLTDIYSSPFRAYLDFDIDSLSLPSNLFCSDRNGMAHEIEIRQPYLDYDLFDLVKSFPNKYFINKNISKYILRLMAKKKLNKISNRLIDNNQKIGFEIPMEFLQSDYYQEWVKKKIKSKNFDDYFPKSFQYINNLLENSKISRDEFLKESWYFASQSEIADIFSEQAW